MRITTSNERQATAQPQAVEQPDDLESLISSPSYQVRRVLRVTQTHWDLPPARGKRAARLARRISQAWAPLRPGAFALLAATARSVQLPAGTAVQAG